MDGDVVSQIGRTVFGDFLNLFFLNAKYDIGVAIRALKGTGHFQTLAEPNLIAYNGQEASFLAGGEFPVPVVQGATGSVTVAVQGIRHPLELHAEDRGRCDTAEGASGSELAGLSPMASRSADSVFRRSLPGARRPMSNFAMDNRSRLPGCWTTLRRKTIGRALLSSIPIIGHFFKSKAERSGADRTDGAGHAQAGQAAGS